MLRQDEADVSNTLTQVSAVCTEYFRTTGDGDTKKPKRRTRKEVRFCGFVRISANSEERQAHAAAKDEITI